MHSFPTRLALALAGAWAAAGGSSARDVAAQTAPPPPAPTARIAIVVPETSGSDPLTARLGSELAAVGLEVVVVRAPNSAAPGRESLEEAARAADALAAVRVVPSSLGVEIWVADRITGKTVLRQVITGEDAPLTQEAVVAFRVVELLRASLLETHVLPAASKAAPPPPAVQALAALPGAAPTEPAPQRLAIIGGAAAALTWGGPRASLHALFDVRFRAVPGLSIHALALLPVVAGRIESSEGVAHVSPTLVGGGIELAPRTAPGRFLPSVGAGAALVVVRMDGVARQPFVGHIDTVAAGAGYARAGAGWALTRWLALRADVVLAVAAPRPVIEFVGRRVASWGRPAVMPSLGLEVRAR